MKRHILPLIIMLSVLGGVFFLLVHSTWFFNYFGPVYIKRQLKEEYSLEKFNVNRQKFSFPETFVLQDVQVSFTKEDKTCEIAVKEITLYEFFTYLKKKENIKVMVKGLSLTYDRLVLKDLNMKGLLFFQGRHLSQLNGIFAGQRLDVSAYHVENFEGQLRGVRNRIQLTDLVADAYGGLVKGQIVMESNPQLNYIIWLELADLKPELLTGTGQPLFSQLRGDLSGAMRLIWAAQQVNLLAVNLQFNKGGLILPGLAEKILAFDGNAVAKTQLSSMRAPDGSVKVGQGKMRLQNADEYRFSLEYALIDEGQGFKLREQQVIPIPGGISRLLFPADE
ncbi:MAG TPA: hypothetical protein PLB05_04965 [Candidatus Omnitrophota bacterium]|nr:hypothetical protein [Candidatus Omnitrophota bacterium]HPN56098.1 hypothetical protein [Candidatus Omnitrophota bacterium]